MGSPDDIEYTDADEEIFVKAVNVHKMTGENRAVSVLDSHDDPFAPREGKTLAWKNVNMTLVRL